MPNFTQCAANYLQQPQNQTLINLWGWKGPVRGISPDPTSQISTEGCRVLCGTGSDWYPWDQSSSTITTWVLPVMGILLQAPFVSNAFWDTMFALSRWCGSPMSSLAMILWNIKVSGKCALMVDMAVPYESIPGRKTDFDSIRDSFFLLMNMNQYTMKPWVSQKEEAEGLLRIVLFSKDLKLLNSERTLNELRQELAQDMRQARKRGVVPVFLSTMWFLFSLAISIQSAFSYIGTNATAHDLALGCLLSWMPVLILCSIVDRNPVAADDIRIKINGLVDLVRTSIEDDSIREAFIESFDDRPLEQYERMRQRVEKIRSASAYMNDFFVKFAGQGRVRWHDGAAHRILSDIEEIYIADKGRDWLRCESEARLWLVLGAPSGGLMWFDFRELWQIASSIAIVMATCGGAFILSFYTPTVGLGCRSGGYTVFFSISLGLLIVEMAVRWWTMSDKVLKRTQNRLESISRHDRSRGLARGMSEHFQNFISACSIGFRRGSLKTLSLVLPRERVKRIEYSMERCMGTWDDMDVKERLGYCLFGPIEFLNTAWLLYICLAQTFGVYVSCDCMTSTWNGGGGYIDFKQYYTTNSPWVALYWTSGTVVSAGVMAIAMLYVVIEWCLQSHLSTANYSNAARGLKRTRQFRRLTFPYRFTFDLLITVSYSVFRLAGKALRLQRQPRLGRRSLVWTKRISDEDHEEHPLTEMQEYTETARNRAGSQSPLLRPDPLGHSTLLSPDTAYTQPRRASDYSPRSSLDPPSL